MSETTSDNDDTVRSLAIRTYLNAAYSLYPHVVGRELDSLLWSSNHVRFDWKAMLVTNFSKQGGGGSTMPLTFAVPRAFTEVLKQWTMREKNNFLYTIAKRKVYVYDGIVHSEDPKKNMSKNNKKKLKNDRIQRVEFGTLPHLPLCPSIV